MRTSLAALVGGLLALLTACVPPISSLPTPPVTVTASPGLRGTSPVEEMDDSELGDWSEATHARFGQAVKLASDSGTISISEPTLFQPSEDATLRDGWEEFVVLEVTETNDWADPTRRWSISAATGSQEAPQVIDTFLGVGRPEQFVRTGESISYRIGFGRSHGAPFVVTAAAPIGYDVVVFQ